MRFDVILSICGRQSYQDQDPEIIELVTEGTMEFRDGGWDIVYDESELTGLQGVTTIFRVEREKVILNRTGRLNSQMVFKEGVCHESLYQMEFGALMLSVCATRVYADLCDEGGMIDIVYNIDIEQSAAGTIDYHVDIRRK